MTGHKHATDRVDVTILAQCAEAGDEHIEFTLEAGHSEHSADELFVLEECPECGADIARITREEPSEVLD